MYHSCNMLYRLMRLWPRKWPYFHVWYSHLINANGILLIVLQALFQEVNTGRGEIGGSTKVRAEERRRSDTGYLGEIICSLHQAPHPGQLLCELVVEGSQRIWSWRQSHNGSSFLDTRRLHEAQSQSNFNCITYILLGSPYRDLWTGSRCSHAL